MESVGAMQSQDVTMRRFNKNFLGPMKDKKQNSLNRFPSSFATYRASALLLMHLDCPSHVRV